MSSWLVVIIDVIKQRCWSGSSFLGITSYFFVEVKRGSSAFWGGITKGLVAKWWWVYKNNKEQLRKDRQNERSRCS